MQRSQCWWSCAPPSTRCHARSVVPCPSQSRDTEEWLRPADGFFVSAWAQGVVLNSGHGFVAVPAWVLQLALCVGVCVNVAVLVSIFVGRLCLFRGNMVNGRWRSDHLSCRSLAWWELWVICPKRGVSYPGSMAVP